MQLCNYHQNQDTEYCHYSKNSFILLCSESLLSTFSFWQWLFWSLMLQFCQLKGIIHINGPIGCIWHLSLSMMLLRFIHIVTYISSFIFITDYYSVMGIIYLLIHQLVDIWIVSSLGNIMKKKKPTIKICVKVFMWTCVFISLGNIPNSRIARPYVKSTFNILRNCQLFPKAATPFYIPATMY